MIINHTSCNIGKSTRSRSHFFAEQGVILSGGSLPTHIYEIAGLCENRFSIMSHPQGGDHLDSEIQKLKIEGFGAIVSMLTLQEQEELGLLKERWYCEAYDIIYMNFPIRDEVAESDQDTIKFIETLESLQKEKEKILFHCRGGVGRSSMILSLLAAKLGVPTGESFGLISKSRGEIAPESTHQKNWVTKLSKI